MCGRYILEPDDEEHFFQHFGAELSEELRKLPDAPVGVPSAAGLFDGQTTPSAKSRLLGRYNIAPTQLVPIVRHPSHDKLPIDSPRVVREAVWGLIPSWAKERSIGARMINARSETVYEKPSFRTAFKRRRCIVPASGFYEWLPVGKSKQPYLIRRKDGQPFAFAGLFERWKDPESGDPVESCTILTTAANGFMSQIHDRMPVVLETSDFGQWLDPEQDGDAVMPLLRQMPPKSLTGTAVNSKVGNVRTQGPDCISPVPDAPALAEL